MKSILLTSTALIAFGGAALAEAHGDAAGVSFSGSAALGYNDDVEGGFYWDGNIAVSMSAALNGGVTASATFDADFADNNLGEDLVAGGYVLSLSSANANLEFGDVDPAADRHWDDVSGMEFAGFNDVDVHIASGEVDSDGDGEVTDDDPALFDAVLYGNATFGGVTGAISYGVTAGGDIDAMQLAAVGTFGNFGVVVAYQDETALADAVIGVTGTASVAGADIKVSYGDDGAETSTGIGVSYPVGPVVVGGYYTMNDVAEDNYGVSADYTSGPIAVSAFYDVDGDEAGDSDGTEFGVEGSYDVGNGLTVLAGFINTTAAGADEEATNAYYVAGTYDLGGGAELLVSYAEDEANATNDEIGDPEYMHGTTVEVSFSF